MRLIDSGLVPPAASAAWDEALLASVAHGAEDALRLWRRSAPAVSLGRFGSVADSVDSDVARERGVEVVRRMSGGGAVLTGPGTLGISVFVRSRIPPAESAEITGRALVNALRSLGVEAEFSEPNDVLARGRKIAGSAEKRLGPAFGRCSVLMVSEDLDLLDSVLRSRKRAGALTTLSVELGREPSWDDVKRAVARGFADVFRTELRACAPTPVEEEMARRAEAGHGSEG